MLRVFYWKSSKMLGISGEGIVVYNYERELEFVYKGAKLKISAFGEIERDFSMHFDICFDKNRNAYGFSIKYRDDDCSRCKIEFKCFLRKGENIKFNNVIIELIDVYREVEECI